MINAQSRFDAGAVSADDRSRWGWFVVFGIALLIFGFIAFGNLIAATVASVVVVGAMMTVAAIFQIIQAFRVRNWGGFFFWLLGGIFYGIAGLMVFYNPLLAAAVLTLVLAFSLIAS